MTAIVETEVVNHFIIARWRFDDVTGEGDRAQIDVYQPGTATEGRVLMLGVGDTHTYIVPRQGEENWVALTVRAIRQRVRGLELELTREHSGRARARLRKSLVRIPLGECYDVVISIEPDLPHGFNLRRG